MSNSHRTPSKNYTTGCYTTLLLSLAPIAIYALQLLGTVSTVAACAAGILIVAKALIEGALTCHRIHQKPATAPQQLVKLIQVQAPIAGCYLCQKQRPLREYRFEGMRVGLCQDCHHCISATRSRV